MGFPCVCNFLYLPMPLPQLVQVIRRITFVLAAILSYVGLRSSPEISPDHFSPSCIPTALIVVIKRELPVVEFASLYLKKSQCNDEEPICMVCLRWLEAKDEVRELGNCDHAFHRECIDRWVDVGHVACPLCRSQLLTSRRKGMNWIQRV